VEAYPLLASVAAGGGAGRRPDEARPHQAPGTLHPLPQEPHRGICAADRQAGSAHGGWQAVASRPKRKGREEESAAAVVVVVPAAGRAYVWARSGCPRRILRAAWRGSRSASARIRRTRGRQPRRHCRCRCGRSPPPFPSPCRAPPLTPAAAASRGLGSAGGGCVALVGTLGVELGQSERLLGRKLNGILQWACE
jgi:hypothetical protein